MSVEPQHSQKNWSWWYTSVTQVLLDLRWSSLASPDPVTKFGLKRDPVPKKKSIESIEAISMSSASFLTDLYQWSHQYTCLHKQTHINTLLYRLYCERIGILEEVNVTVSGLSARNRDKTTTAWNMQETKNKSSVRVLPLYRPRFVYRQYFDCPFYNWERMSWL